MVNGVLGKPFTPRAPFTPFTPRVPFKRNCFNFHTLENVKQSGKMQRLVLVQANKKNGFTVTWSKYPTINHASDPQKPTITQD